MTTVVVADDEALFRGGLGLVLGGRPGITVVGEAADGVEAVAAVRQHRPDVVLMDVQMPRVDGIEATRQLSRLRVPTKVLMLTTFGMERYVVESLRAGASGFLLKSVPPETLVEGIATIARGDALLSPVLLRGLIEDWIARGVPEDDPRVTALTDREREVLRLVARGQSNAELARALNLAEPTVKTHIGRLLTKTGARDRAQLVIVAYESGLVRPGH